LAINLGSGLERLEKEPLIAVRVLDWQKLCCAGSATIFLQIPVVFVYIFMTTFRFQTDLLTLIMDHLVDADILIGEQAALPIVPGQAQG
jgi:hypothetical protein